MPATILAIDDVDDPRIADYRKLAADGSRADRRVREQGAFIAEGRLVVERLLASPHRVRSLLIEPHRLAELEPWLASRQGETTVFVASRELHARITDVRFHQGMLAIGESEPLEPAQALAHADRALIVERAVNHENLGGLLRNLAAFAGARGALLLDPRSADPLYRKSIRVSMGFALQVPHARVERWTDDLRSVQGAGFAIVALHPRADGSVADLGALRERKVALLVGTEGEGLSDQALEAADRRVRVPIDASVDSLNLSVAAAIALHRLR